MEGGDNDSINLHVQNLPYKHHVLKISYQSNAAMVVCSTNTSLLPTGNTDRESSKDIYITFTLYFKPAASLV